MEYLTFQKFITPIIIQIIFWIAVLFIVVGGIVAITQGNAGQGILIILFGPIIARVYAELLMVLFNIEGEVKRIAAVQAGPSTGTGPMTTSSPTPSPTPSA